MMTRRLLAGLLTAVLAWTAAAAEPPPDPLGSSQWPTMVQLFFKDQPVVFDDRVEVLAPPEAEDSMNLPVAVRYPDLADAREVLVFIDYNPIPKVLTFHPRRAGPFLAFRVRLQQATPVRAAVRDAAGVWHVGGVWVDAAGGGCTLPDMAGSGIDEDLIGQVRGRVWERDDGGRRLKFQVIHPNDTGLVMGTPAFFVQTLEITGPDGAPVARLDTYEPLSESPDFTLEVPPGLPSGNFRVRGRDNQGIRIDQTLGGPA